MKMYRLLNIGEKVKVNDNAFDRQLGVWTDDSEAAAGTTVSPHHWLFRREIDPITRQDITQQKRYRLLNPGELFHHDDEMYAMGKWRIFSFFGGDVVKGDSLPIRREIK